MTTMSEMKDSEYESNFIHSNVQTLMGYEDDKAAVPFINNSDPATDDDCESVDDTTLPQTGITMMGFAQNDSNDTTEQTKTAKYSPNDRVLIFAKILRYNESTRSYSLQLESNKSNESINHVIHAIPSQYIHDIPQIPTVETKHHYITYVPAEQDVQGEIDVSSTSDNDNDNDNDGKIDDLSIKHTSKRDKIPLSNRHYNIRKDLKCMLSLFASDGRNIKTQDDDEQSIFVNKRLYHNKIRSSRPIGAICDDMMRVDPFKNQLLSNNKDDDILSVKDLLQFDEKHNIYYYWLGTGYSEPDNQIFFTPKFKWPKKYCVAMWINWKNTYSIDTQNTVLTTFDSLHHAPIFVDNYGHIGVHHVNGNQVIPQYIVKPGWQFVIAVGSMRNTLFYIGDLKMEPDCIGSVGISICGKETERIGEIDQGPGKVGFIGVWSGHLTISEMKQLYHETINEMSGTWTTRQMEIIHAFILKLCNGVQVIASLTMNYAKFNRFSSKF